MITFDVSAVKPDDSPLARIDLSASLESRVKSPVEACGANAAAIVVIPQATAAQIEGWRQQARDEEEDWTEEDEQEFEQEFAKCARPFGALNSLNGFLAALGLAFDGHYPLVLSPDDIWLCIAQGFATHVKQNAEALRSRFVQHEGRVELHVERDDFVKGAASNPWPEVLTDFSNQMATHVGKKRDLVVADFSTTGAIERTATEIVLMDAMQHYYEYSFGGLCGIPRITLRGTIEDWRRIRTRANNLTEFAIDEWARELLPVLDEIVATAEGAPNVEFWKSIYTKEEVSGRGRLITGWCQVFFPYLYVLPYTWRQRYGYQRIGPNRYLDVWRREPSSYDYTRLPALEHFPSGLSTVPFTCTWQPEETEIPMELLGGFVGVAQNDDLSVQPAIGWAVRERPSP